MTSVFGADGKNIPCTVIEAGPCVVTQLKTPEKDGYSAVQIAYDETTEKHTSNSLLGHFKKANTTPKRKLVEFTSFENELNLGDVITVDIFEENDWVDVTGISKGRDGRTRGKSSAAGAVHGHFGKHTAQGPPRNAAGDPVFTHKAHLEKGKGIIGYDRSVQGSRRFAVGER